MDWVDWVVVSIILATTLFGLFRGLIYEVVSLLGWIGAFLAARYFSADTYRLVSSSVDTEVLRWVIAWTAPFLLVLLLAAVVKFLLREAVEATGLGGVNLALGGLFGALKGALVVTFVVLILRLSFFADTQPIRPESVLLPYFDRFAALLANPIKGFLAERLTQLQQRVKLLDSQGEAPDPDQLMTEMGWDKRAVAYLKQHPELLQSVFDQLADNPNWQRRWQAMLGKPKP